MASAAARRSAPSATPATGATVPPSPTTLPPPILSPVAATRQPNTPSDSEAESNAEEESAPLRDQPSERLSMEVDDLRVDTLSLDAQSLKDVESKKLYANVDKHVTDPSETETPETPLIIQAPQDLKDLFKMIRKAPSLREVDEEVVDFKVLALPGLQSIPRERMDPIYHEFSNRGLDDEYSATYYPGYTSTLIPGTDFFLFRPPQHNNFL